MGIIDDCFNHLCISFKFDITNAGMETLKQDLTMEDKNTTKEEDNGKARDVGSSTPKTLKAYTRRNKKKRVKIPEDSDFKQEPVIEIGSPSRCTRSTSRSKQNKDETPKKENKDDTVILSDSKSKVKCEGSSVQGDPVSKESKNTDSEDQEKKRKTNSKDSTDPLRKRTYIANLRTRTSPRTLKETVTGLTDDQEKAARELCLGSLLEMALDGVPSKLGFFVVDKLDTRKMQLDIPSGSIAITVESIRDLLGLPMGGIDLLYSDDRSFGLKLTKDWQRQFQKLNIRPSDIMHFNRFRNSIHHFNNTTLKGIKGQNDLFATRGRCRQHTEFFADIKSHGKKKKQQLAAFVNWLVEKKTNSGGGSDSGHVRLNNNNNDHDDVVFNDLLPVATTTVKDVIDDDWCSHVSDVDFHHPTTQKSIDRQNSNESDRFSGVVRDHRSLGDRQVSLHRLSSDVESSYTTSLFSGTTATSISANFYKDSLTEETMGMREEDVVVGTVASRNCARSQ
ncbi:hypothetical protein L6452_30359 [Arctium lappa]|uniref:Uncharacterized protein n=1 Tax=Arctium lappa TaxID=4217 RepID=A0ACB8ZHE3_ARCLA|nr:hypothetical protein L6452_30359 [Arctium lappa]